jgi:hypothetical protein
MKLPVIAVVLLLSMSSAYAGDTGSGTLCPDPKIPVCVVSNWGQIDPAGVDSAMAPTTSSAAQTAQGPHSTVRMMTIVTPPAATKPAATKPLQTLVSPNGLFPKETAALTAAIKNARFNADGVIVRGEKELAAAAAEAARRAGNKYVLTFYIKVSQQLKPDLAATLDKKVAAVNRLLSDAQAAAQAGEPKS